VLEALTQEKLAPMMCSDPLCTDPSHKLFFHSKCHPTRPVQAMYDKATGTMTVTCAVDGRFIARLLVAKGGENPMSEVTKDPNDKPEEAEEGEAPEGQEEGEEEGEGEGGESEPKAEA